VRYIYADNGGPSKARNLGIKNAKGDFIAFLIPMIIGIPKVFYQDGSLPEDTRP